MASVQWDSELMTNYTEAVNIPAGQKLRASVDELSKQPAVFSLSNHQVPKLQLIRVNSQGRRTLTDIAPLLNVPANSIIDTFDVQQSADLTIFLAFSVKVDDRESNLWVIKPFKLAEEIKLSAFPIKPVGRIHDIHIGPFGEDGSGYPAVYLMHQPLSRTAKNNDLAQIRVSLEKNTWEERKELTLPVNVQKILDVAPAYAGFFGHGLIYLCEQNARRSLYGVFIRPGEQLGDRGTAEQYKFPCPEDALSIATFTDFDDNDGRSSLLIGCGAGVRFMPATELTAAGGVSSTLINNDECLTGARELHVSQAGRNLSLFCINAQDELAFLTTTLASLRSARAAPILPAGSVTSYCALLAATKGSVHHSLICNDSAGNLTFVQQALDTGIWRHEPFFVEASGEMAPFESYTTTVTVRDAQKNPFINGRVQIQTSSMLPVIINGRLTFLSPAGAWYDLDSAGELGMIIPTKTITSQPITIKGLRDANAKAIELPETMIDPASKVVSRMSSLDSEKALLDSNLWEGSSQPSGDELKAAAKCFGAMKEALKELPKDGKQVAKFALAANGTPSNAVKTGNIFMDAFLWVRSKVKQATNWIIRKAGQFWEFVCDIGGKIVNFVLDCVEKLTEAASWVWEKLKVGWEKLCKFVGFLFSWDDILETKDTIVGFLNAGLDMAANRVEGFNAKIDGLFSNIQKTVADATGATSKPGYKAKVQSSKPKEDKKMNDLQNSAPSKWAGERMKNGNAKNTVASQKVPKGEDKDSAELVGIWSDRVEPILKDFNTLVEDLAKDIATLFKEDKNLSQEALLKRLGGNLLVNILEIVKKLLQAIVSVVAKVVLIVKSFGNLKLSGGFLNSFYRWVSHGKDLTIFEAVSLLIAIPSTFIIKLVTNAKAPTFKKIDAKFIESIIAAQKPGAATGSVKPASKETIRDVTTLILGCGCGAATIKVFHKTVKLAYKTVTGGVSIGVGAMSPSAIMEMFGMAIDAFSLYKDIFAEPVDADTPGKELMDIATAVKAFRLAANALYMLASKLGMDNPVAEQIVLCIDLITALINFSLYSAVYSKQLDATSWKDHDEEILITASADNFLETLSTIGYFTAASLKTKAPPVALVGMACFQVAAWGGVATKGISFGSEYKKL